jgi:hypothetical protein
MTTGNPIQDQESLTMITNRLVPLLSLFCLGATSCTRMGQPTPSEFLTKHLGQECTVQFRRDALGASAAEPISPTTTGLNNSLVIQRGKLLVVEQQGVALEVVAIQPPHGKSIFWIPTSSILSVEVAQR